MTGTSWLLLNATGTINRYSLFVYCAGLLTMLVASTLYHLAPPTPVKELLLRIDYAAIFVMIAGTYTPFIVNRIDPTATDFAVPAIWIGAAAGVMLKLCFPRRFEIVGVAIYLAFGWAGISMFEPLSQSINTVSLILLVTGGLTYSVGVVFHLLSRVPFHNAIWHTFVLAAAGQHFVSIAAEFLR